jgi:hypothetical protein
MPSRSNFRLAFSTCESGTIKTKTIPTSANLFQVCQLISILLAVSIFSIITALPLEEEGKSGFHTTISGYRGFEASPIYINIYL